MLNLIRLLVPSPSSNSKMNNFPYNNKEGIVGEIIYPGRKGCVYANGIWWQARCVENITLKPEDIVNIIGMENITIWVELLSSK